MSADLSAVMLYKNLPAEVKAQLWEKKVTLDAAQKNALSQFVGDENSNMPIIRKRDLSKGGAGKVFFNTTAGNRGRGRVGEQELKSATDKLTFNGFAVEVDWLRHAISWSRKNESHLPFGGSIPKLTSDVMGQWLGRKEEDDYQITLRNQALYATGANANANIVRLGNRPDRASMVSADLLSTSEIERSKSILSGKGAKPFGITKGDMGSEIFKFLMFAPDQVLRPLRGSTSYLEALKLGGERGDKNQLFTGAYAMWDDNVIYPHNVFLQDDIDGPQGSPLAPVAYLGTALANVTPTEITGGGTAYPAGTGDYFSYFEGYAWTLYEDEVTPDLSANTYYACIYNASTDGKYEIVSYAGNANSGNKLTTVIRGTSTTTGGVAGGGNVLAQAAGRFSNVHPSGALIFPCTVNGVPLGWALHLGAQALFHATGVVEAEPIFYWDDFRNAKGEFFLKSVGLQSIRGLTPKKSSTGRMPNFVLVEGAIQLPGVNMVTVA